MRLTLRTLLAYLDDTLPPEQARTIGQKVAESETAQELIDRIKKVTRRRGLSTPTTKEDRGPSDPNTVAEYLGDALSADQLAQFEKACLDSDVHLAEAAACHQILTLLLSEPVRVPPTARQRMYQLVKGRESLPHRKPGLTVPVTGELPYTEAADADESDAAFLLGMRAYSGSEPWRSRALPLAAVAVVLVCLAGAVWLAFPSPVRRPAEFADAGPVAGNGQPGPHQNREEPPTPAANPPGTPEKTTQAGPAKPAATDQAKAATEKEAAKPPAKSPETPPGQLVPQPAKPKTDRLVAARLESPDAVVVSHARGDAKWLRATAKEPDLYATDRVVCLPGYKAKVTVDEGTELELWGNVPEQQPVIPVLETAVTFNSPADGFDAELTVHAGRVYLTSRRPAGSKVRLRVRDEVWDVTLPDNKTEAVVEVVNSLVQGISKDIDPSELPLTTAVLAVTKGAAGLKARYKDLPQVKANEVVEWSSKGQGLRGPNKVQAGPGGGPSAYFSRYELPVGEQAKAAQEALADLSKRAKDRDAIRIAFAEMLREDDSSFLPARVAGARIAVLGQAAIDDLPPLIDALNDSGRLFL